MSEFKVILTNAGVAAFAQATSTSTTVDFSKFAVGDGNGSYYTPTPDLTTLKNERWRGDVLDIKQVPGTSKIEVTTVIPATLGGWYIREMAIFSADGTMLAIGKVPESYKPDPLSGSSKDLSIKAVFEVSNASVVNIVIDPNNVIANKKYVDDKVSDLEQRAGTAIGVVDERVTQHLAQTVAATATIVRNLSLAGNQKVILPFKPKTIQVIGVTDDGLEVNGFWGGVGYGFCIGTVFADGNKFGSGYLVQISNNGNLNYVTGKLLSVESDGFTIEWSIGGTPIDDTLKLYVLATTHGGEVTV